jgi:Holliday junction DNA helicase RuvB
MGLVNEFNNLLDGFLGRSIEKRSKPDMRIMTVEESLRLDQEIENYRRIRREKLREETYPKNLDDVFGQATTIKALKEAITATKKRNSVLGHVLFYGPAGLGKSTLAKLIAKELDKKIIMLSAASLRSVAKTEEFIFRLREGDVLFIDEIHALTPKMSDLLLPVMQDFVLNTRYIPKFTVVGATTEMGSLPRPLRDRFKHQYELENYTNDEIAGILVMNGDDKGLDIQYPHALFLAQRSLQVPRIGLNLLQAMSDRVTATGEELCMSLMREKLFEMGIDSIGLQKTHRRILDYLESTKRPVSAQTICSANDVDPSDLNEFERPLLVHRMIIKTSRGREITDAGRAHLQKARKEGHM